MCVSHSVVSDSVTQCTVAHQAPLSMGFSRQECWSGLAFPPPRDLPNPGIEPGSPALQADSVPSEPLGKPQCVFLFTVTSRCFLSGSSQCSDPLCSLHGTPLQGDSTAGKTGPSVLETSAASSPPAFLNLSLKFYIHERFPLLFFLMETLKTAK